MPPSPEPVDSQSPLTAAFADILCAVDGSCGSALAVRQAIELARPDGRITFMSVTDVRGIGANRVAGLGEHRATLALRGARALARDHGVRCDTELVHAAVPVDEILARQGSHDLLAVGSHLVSRVGGIMTGSVATAVAHAMTGPTLIARPSASPAPFPRRIVVATDAGCKDDAVIQAAIRLAVVRNAHLHVAHATAKNASARDRAAVGAIGAAIWTSTETEPLVTAEAGDPVGLVTKLVENDGANLLVTGHGGRRGLSALGSVSERLVHRAPCSVLVIPTPARA